MIRSLRVLIIATCPWALGAGCGNASRVDTPLGAGATSTATGTKTGTSAAHSDQASSNAGNTACVTEADCPPANMDIASDAFSQAGLVGYAGEKVLWILKGQDRNSKDRRVGLLLNNVPAGSAFTPQDSVDTIATITWLPTSAQKNTAKLEIYMRDLDRCELLEVDRQQCTSYVFLQSYDKMVEVDWQILKRSSATDTATSTSTKTQPDSVKVSSTPSGGSTTAAAGGTSALGSLGSLGSLGGLAGGSSGLGFLSSFLGSGSGLGSAGSSLGALGSLGSFVGSASGNP